MKNLTLSLFLILFISCTIKQDITKGDLFFKLVSITSPSGMSNEESKKIEKLLDSVGSSNTVAENEVIDYFKLLKKHNLLENPFIQLKVGKEIKKVFLSKKEYEKISLFTLNDLQQRNKKVEIELEVKELEKDLFLSNKILSIEEVDGETPWQK